jgi:hypothetical protein
MMSDMGRDDEFDEFDITADEIDRVIDEGEPVEFGDDVTPGVGVVIHMSTFQKVGTTTALGHAEQLGDKAAASG